MNTQTNCPLSCLLAALALLTVVVPSRAADAPVRYQASPKDTLVLIQGTSTVHDWEMKGPSIAGFVEFPAGTVFDTSQATVPGLKDGKLAVNVKASIPVRSIRSEAEVSPEIMERLMQKALNETNFARIEYRATELELQTPHAAGQPFIFDAAGELVIAGVTNKVDFPVTVQPLDADKIKIHGEAKLKMTAYGVTPPAPNFGLGLMKCGDDLKIIFDWTLQQKPAAPAAPK
jgi:polyisoprenoid-binding protein YceI